MAFDLLEALDFVVAAVVVAWVGCFLVCPDFAVVFVVAAVCFPAVFLAGLWADCLSAVADCLLALVFASDLFVVAVDFSSYRPYQVFSDLSGPPGRRTQALFLLA